MDLARYVACTMVTGPLLNKGWSEKCGASRSVVTSARSGWAASLPAITQRWRITFDPSIIELVTDSAFRDAAVSEWTERVFGAGLPPEVDPFSFIPGDGLHEIVGLLVDCRGRTALDLACGRGGPGLWVARQIGADLIGIDFSPVGIDHARSRAAHSAGDVRTRYVVADAANTDLPSDSIDGVVCVDAIQLMSDKANVAAEVRRALRPDALAVFTTWEEADRLPDLAALFEAAGLLVVSVAERPDWMARERAIFEQAMAEAPIYRDDAALQSLAQEAQRALPLFDRARRVLGVGKKPH